MGQNAARMVSKLRSFARHLQVPYRPIPAQRHPARNCRGNDTQADVDLTVSFTVSEAQDIADALHVAMDDIRELLQVAKYNLRGQINTGEIVEKPNPPQLVHEAGIAKSEAVMERCRKVWVKVWDKIQNEQMPNG